MDSKKQLGDNLRAAREAVGLKQDAVAEALGIHKVTVSNHERGATAPDDATLRRYAGLYRTTPSALRYGRSYGVADELAREPYQKNPDLRRRWPPSIYAEVVGYLDRLEAAGVPHDDIDEAERLMLELTFSKLHKKDVRERSDEELRGDVRAAWDAVVVTFRDEGVRV